MPTETLQTVPPPALSKAEESIIKKTMRSCKSQTVVTALTSLLVDRPIAPAAFPDIVAFLDHPNGFSRPDHKAAVILCRVLPPGSPEAEQVGTILADNYHKSSEGALWGCLGTLIGLVAALLLNSNAAIGAGMSDYSPLYRMYLTTLTALQVPQGAYVVANLALSQPQAQPTDLGSEALTVLPSLLERVIACKPGDLPETHAVTFAYLVTRKQFTDPIKLLALQAVEAVGSSATAVTMQKYDRKEMSPAIASEWDRVLGVLTTRQGLLTS